MNTTSYKFFSLCIITILSLCGCAKYTSSSNFISIKVGMEKSEIIKKLGDPAVVRGSIINKFGQVVEVFEYKVDMGIDAGRVIVASVATLGLIAPFLPFCRGTVETYWLYFYNNKLVQWGKAGDWEKAADYISEIRFR